MTRIHFLVAAKAQVPQPFARAIARAGCIGCGTSSAGWETPEVKDSDLFGCAGRLIPLILAFSYIPPAPSTR